MTVYSNFCIVWSVVSLVTAGRIEAYGSARASLTKGWRKSSYLPDPLGAGFSPRVTQSIKVAKEERVELSDLETPLYVPQVIERLHLTEDQTLGILPQRVREMMAITAPTPAPRTEPASLQEVSVTCSGTEVTVRVQRGFTPTASELTLGRSCKSTGVNESSGDLLFTYPLASCDFRQEKMPGYILYKYVLHYVPLPTNLPIRRVHGLNVDIQCRFKSIHHVHQLSVQPTWATPKRKTLKGLLPGYGIQTMSAGWAGPAPSNVFLLGQRVHFQAFALHLPPEGRLYVDRCYASISGQPDASPEYYVIENFGCMVDSKINGSNSGFSPQRTNGTIDFALDAFQLLSKSAAEVFLHCQLYVTTADPSPTAKSCTYSHEERRWKEVSGRHWDCTCCNAQCLDSKARQSTYKGFLSSGPLMFTVKDPKPKTSLSLGSTEPETSDPWVNFSQRNTEFKTSSPRFSFSQGNTEPETSSAGLSFSQGNTEAEASDPWDSFSQRNTEPETSSAGLSFSQGNTDAEASDPWDSFSQRNAEPETSDPWVSFSHAKPKTSAPWVSFSQGNAEPETSDPWDGFSQGNIEPKTSDPWDSFSQGNTEPETSDPWDGFSQGNIEPKTSDPWDSFSQGNTEPETSSAGLSFSQGNIEPKTSDPWDSFSQGNTKPETSDPWVSHDKPKTSGPSNHFSHAEPKTSTPWDGFSQGNTEAEASDPWDSFSQRNAEPETSAPWVSFSQGHTEPKTSNPLNSFSQGNVEPETSNPWDSFSQGNTEPKTSDPWVSFSHAKPKTSAPSNHFSHAEPKTSTPLDGFSQGNIEPETSNPLNGFSQGNAQPKASSSWDSFSHENIEPETSDPWDSFSQGNAEPKTSDSWDGFSQGNTEPSFNLGNAVSFEARPEGAEDELEQYEDPEWQEDYEYANVYEEDQYSGEGSHTPSPSRALQGGVEGVGGKEAGSTFWKGVMEMREVTGERKETEVGRGPMFGVREGTMFREGEEMTEEEHLHYGLSSGIGEVIFLSGSD